MKKILILLCIAVICVCTACEDIQQLLGLKDEVIDAVNYGIVHGTVTDYDGTALSSGSVRLYPSTQYTMPVNTEVPVDQNGYFRIEDVPAGSHSIVYNRHGNFTNIPEYAVINNFTSGGFETARDMNSIWVNEGDEVSHNMQVGRVDQNYYPDIFENPYLYYSSTGPCLLAQEFIPIASSLRKLFIRKGFPQGDIDIRTDNGGLPGTILKSVTSTGESLYVIVGNTDASDFFYTADFSDDPVTLTPGNSYWIVSHMDDWGYVIPSDDTMPSLSTYYSMNNGNSWQDTYGLSATPIGDNMFITLY